MLLQQKYKHLVIQHIYQPAQFCFLFKLELSLLMHATQSYLQPVRPILNDHKQFDPCFVLEVLMEWSIMFQHPEIQLPLLD